MGHFRGHRVAFEQTSGSRALQSGPPASASMSAAVLVAAVVGGGVLLLMRRLFPRQKAAQLLRYPADAMRGKTVIVTGANCGIGKALAGELLKLRARVIMACRDRRGAEEAAEDLRKQAGPEQGEVVVKHLDLASLKSVRAFCEEIKAVCWRVDGLRSYATPLALAFERPLWFIPAVFLVQYKG